MELTLTTPAVLFPAISLLMLAYTNRFLHLAALIRKLHSDLKTGTDPLARPQIENLRIRLRLIRWMQILGILSLLGCTISTVALYFEAKALGGTLFAISVLLMALSLIISLREVTVSGGALAILLKDLEK